MQDSRYDHLHIIQQVMAGPARHGLRRAIGRR
jgi:hypothetical protein